MFFSCRLFVNLGFTAYLGFGILNRVDEMRYRNMERRKIIMDCDPGIDDAVALAYAASKQDVLELLAVTCVSGNQSIDKVTRNALDLTEFYGLDVPVAKGMGEPLVRKSVFASDVHGQNGIGECELPKAEKQLAEQQAVFFLRELLMNAEEKITFVCTGPMTNIALLLKLFPEVKEHIEEIVFMGGAARGGNVTPCAEFNIFVDPEAAKIVFDAGIPLVMCGLDVTWKCNIDRKQVLKLCQSGNPVAKVCGEMIGYSIENSDNKYRGKACMHDVVPWMYLIHPEYFKCERVILDVDCSDNVTRGAIMSDLRWWKHEPDEMSDLMLVDVDERKFQEELILALYELGAEIEQKKRQ